MAEEKGTLQIIAEHLVLAVQPLKDAVADLESFRTFMLRLGWEVESLPQEYVALATHADAALAALEALSA